MPDTLLEAPALKPKTDPARFEVVKNALYSAAEEMKIVLAKTAYSPLLKVAGDYSCGIFAMRTATWWHKGRTCQSISARCPMRCVR
jgi:hypothetical protein